MVDVLVGDVGGVEVAADFADVLAEVAEEVAFVSCFGEHVRSVAVDVDGVVDAAAPVEYVRGFLCRVPFVHGEGLFEHGGLLGVDEVDERVEFFVVEFDEPVALHVSADANPRPISPKFDSGCPLFVTECDDVVVGDFVRVALHVTKYGVLV